MRHPDRTTKQHVLNTRNAYPCSVDVGNAGRGTEAAAAALVRADLPPIGTPTATLKISDGTPLNGGTIHLWDVRTTANSSFLYWTITHPTVTARVVSDTQLPYLRYGDTTIRASQSQRFSNAWVEVRAIASRMNSTALRPGYILYAPLPDDLTEVTVGVDASKQTAKLTVQHGPAPLPAGTADIPILGRALALNRFDLSDEAAMIFTVHGVRRIPGATAVYYSMTGPTGATPPNPKKWVGDSVISTTFIQGFGVNGSVHLIDHPHVTGYSGIPSSGANIIGTDLRSNPSAVINEQSAEVAWLVLPELPATTTEVDVLIAGQYFLSVPVQDGVMTPAVTGKRVALGSGWPTIDQAALATVPQERIDSVHVALRDNAKTKAVTKTGGGNVDLNADVLFDYNKATLTSQATAVIATAAQDIQATGKTGQLTITGHTDSDGTDDYNQKLSEARAQTVANALKKQLPTTYTYKVVGAGEKQPIATNNTTQGRARNRRVAITLPGQ